MEEGRQSAGVFIMNEDGYDGQTYDTKDTSVADSGARVSRGEGEDPRVVEHGTSEFEKIRRRTEDGGEFWSARDLAKILGYTDYRNFVKVIRKAELACQNSGQKIGDHFVDVTDMVEIGSGAK